jgi:hypothetical protein
MTTTASRDTFPVQNLAALPAFDDLIIRPSGTNGQSPVPLESLLDLLERLDRPAVSLRR